MSVGANSIKGQIRHYVLEQASRQGTAEVGDDDSLLDNGVIDSLGLLRVVIFLQDTFTLTIEDSEVSPENFKTVNLIEAFVMRKVSGDESVNCHI